MELHYFINEKSKSHSRLMHLSNLKKMTLDKTVVKYSNNKPIAREGDVLERHENVTPQM